MRIYILFRFTGTSVTCLTFISIINSSQFNLMLYSLLSKVEKLDGTSFIKDAHPRGEWEEWPDIHYILMAAMNWPAKTWLKKELQQICGIFTKSCQRLWFVFGKSHQHKTKGQNKSPFILQQIPLTDLGYLRHRESPHKYMNLSNYLYMILYLHNVYWDYIQHLLWYLKIFDN